MSNLKLISLHIPKTAGTSFYNSLQEAYGESNIARIDFKPNLNSILLNYKEMVVPEIPNKVEIIHGHFTLEELHKTFPETLNLPIITWLREPINRIISNYYYLVTQLENTVTNNDEHKMLMKRMMKSIEEYIIVPENRNRMSHFIKNYSLKDFLFVGIVENYNEELLYLSNKLTKTLHEKKLNTNSNKKLYTISDDIKNLIIEMNLEDIELYKEALSIRERRK